VGKKLQLLFLIISPILFAQTPKSLVKTTKIVTQFDEYEGSIYNSLKYKSATIIDEKSRTFDTKLRYNAYTDALELKQQGELLELIKKPTLHARIDDDYYYFCEFKTVRGIKKHGYYVLVELNERYKVYKKYSVDVKRPNPKGSSNGTSAPGEVTVKTAYFIEEKGTIVELPQNKKEFLATFNDKEEELKDYIKKEKIKVRKEEDLIRLVSKYNSLKIIGSGPSRSLLSGIE